MRLCCLTPFLVASRPTCMAILPGGLRTTRLTSMLLPRPLPARDSTCQSSSRRRRRRQQLRPVGLSSWNAQAKALLARAALSAKKDISKAWSDILAVHRLAALMIRDGSGTEVSSGYVLASLADDITQSLVMGGKIERRVLEAMLVDLRQVTPSYNAASTMDKVDRPILLDVVQKAASADRQAAAAIVRPVLVASFADRKSDLNQRRGKSPRGSPPARSGWNGAGWLL